MTRALGVFVGVLLAAQTALAAPVTVTYPQTAYIYATASGILRQIIIPGQGETTIQSARSGETIVVRPSGSPTDEASIRTAITAAIGKAIASDHCAVVNNGTNKVTRVTRCDPALDAIGGSTLVQHPLAVSGDTWTGGATFTRNFAVVNPTTNIVEQLVSLSIDAQIPPVGRVLYPSDNLKVGDHVPVKAP